MNRFLTKFHLGLFIIGMVSFFNGCASTLPYQRASEGIGGYTDKAGDTPGSFQVDFMADGRTLAFAKYAAYYRAAELTFETGYRYFIILNTYDLTKKAKVWGDPKDRLAGETPGVQVLIQCYMEKPVQPSYDAYQYLNTAKMPGSDEIYSIAQRKGDQAGQPVNIK